MSIERIKRKCLLGKNRFEKQEALKQELTFDQWGAPKASVHFPFSDLASATSLELGDSDRPLPFNARAKVCEVLYCAHIELSATPGTNF